jgi:hypothetical protein
MHRGDAAANCRRVHSMHRSDAAASRRRVHSMHRGDSAASRSRSRSKPQEGAFYAPFFCRTPYPDYLLKIQELRGGSLR